MLEERKVKIFLLTLIIALTVGIGIKAFVGFKAAPIPTPEMSGTVPTTEQTGSQNQTQPQVLAQGQEMVVYVTGAVAKPGLVKLAPGARLADALAAAEQSPDADITSLNLAEKVKDGEKIVVPKVGEVQTQASGPSGQGTGNGSGQPATGGTNSTGKVNINTADEKELDTLPGIGPALAERIITYRDENGPFSQIDELKQVSGIGDKKFADIQALVDVN